MLLLAMIVERLRRREASLLRDSLTHRELVAAGAGLSGVQVEALRTVAQAAERVTFDAWVPSEPDLEPVIAEGRALLAGLDAAPVQRR